MLIGVIGIFPFPAPNLSMRLPQSALTLAA
jgi:hypothetical protein